MKKARSKKIKDIIFVMLYTKSLYAVWMQRNNKVFNHILMSPNIVVKDIIYKVFFTCSKQAREKLIK